MTALVPLGLALGITCLHALWQGALLAVVVRVAEPALVSATPAQRARTYGAALCALPSMSLITLLSLLAAPQGNVGGTAGAGIPWLGLAWVAGASLMLTRLSVQWMSTRRLRQRARPVAAQAAAQLAELACLMEVAPPPMFESADVDGPMLQGVFRPVLLVPLAFFVGLGPRELELVLRHELAHLARLDPLLNALQGVIEAVYFFHPAAWWLSARVREQRECACDELAVESASDRLILARALTQLAASRIDHPPEVVALAATGGPLMQRVRSLVQPARPPFEATTLAAPLLALSLGVSLAVAACASASTLEYTERAAPFVDAIEQASEQHGVPAALIAAVIEAESNFDPAAESPTGARGLMQLMPGTADTLGVDDAWDPAQNIDGGTTYLRMMLDRYDGDVALATAAYNAGPEAVDAAGGVPDNGETPRYVRAVLDRYAALAR